MGSVANENTKVRSKLKPKTFVVQQNYPNPFNPETRIQYELLKSGLVEVKIFNLMGQEIRALEYGTKSAGSYSLVWNGRDNFGRQVSSVIYIYTITVTPDSGSGKRFEASRKLILVR